MIGELTNHLWQSTLFAVAAGLLTAAFRGNKAQVRHWLWFSASLKFLLPFALLLSLGSHLERTPSLQKIAAPAVSPAVSEAMLQIAEPFSAAPSFAPPARQAIDWVLIAIFVWACGFAAMAVIRLRDWLQVGAAVRASKLVDIPASVEVRRSPGLLEPGVVGFFRPILLLPAGVVECLTPLQLQAVLAHEMCHVRRRDNLTSAIHMVVEAVFWFHPFVWFIGARIVEERERACDEAVLSLGGEPRDYAEGILSVCKLYTGSPLVCVSGVTGANLKRRIESIIANRTGQRLNRLKKLLLASAGVAALVGPVVLGLIAGIGNSVVRAQSRLAVPAPVTVVAQAAKPLATPRVAAAPLPIQDHRLLALLFDFGAMTSDQQSRARQAAINFVRNQMGASDRVALMTVEGGKATFVNDFTDDKTLLESALLQLNPGSADDSPFSGIEAAAKMLGAFPGKKELIYFAPGMAQGPSNQAELDETVTAAREANVALYPIDMRAATGLVIPLAAPGGRSMVPQADKRPEFETVSIKPTKPNGGGAIPIGRSANPGSVTLVGITPRHVVALAYSLKDYQVSGPAWIDEDRYDIMAKVGRPASDAEQELMLQSMLADRFQLATHTETRVLPAYELVVGKGGPKFHEATPNANGSRVFPNAPGISAKNISMPRLAELLSMRLDRPVTDKTGLSGLFDIELKWTPDSAPPDTDPGPSVFTAIQDQLGLTLQPRRLPMEVLAIDHMSKPSAN